jgi:hypothetical protein
MRKLHSYEEITDKLRGIDEGDSEIVEVDVIPNYMFTYNKSLDQCDIWVTNGITTREESFYQLVNIIPLQGQDWEDFKQEGLIDYARIIYMGWFHSTLPEELTFQV